MIQKGSWLKRKNGRERERRERERGRGNSEYKRGTRIVSRLAS
jgi:hypothetical protein